MKYWTFSSSGFRVDLSVICWDFELFWVTAACICTYRVCVFAQVKIKTPLCHSQRGCHSLRCITVNTEIPPEWAQRWVLISVSLNWVNMMMWTVINSSSYHLWAWGTGLFMAVGRTFISPGRSPFYLYGSLETNRKCYYTQDLLFFFFLSSFLPKTNDWGQIQMKCHANESKLTAECVSMYKRGF